MLQPQAAMRPRIDDIIIHVDKLIAKFSQWVTLQGTVWHFHISQSFKKLACNCAFTVQLYIDWSKSSHSSSPHRINRICIFFVFGVRLDSWALDLLKELFIIFT
jgi:hypothetical protein